MPIPATAVEALACSPAWLPLDAAGPGTVRLVRLTEPAYRAASFLDQRLLAATPPQALLPAASVATAVAGLAPKAHYIFHIGHVGSTLVSRLIGEFNGIFSVREPAILREVRPQPAPASSRTGLDLHTVLRLCARTWRPEQRTVVKATSFVSEMAESILEFDDTAAAIMMFTPPLAYLRCILGGPNSRIESRALAPGRVARLRTRLADAAFGVDFESEGQWIAASWLCEMACLQMLARRFPSRVLWVDFDRFLAAPRASLEAILGALRVDARPTDVDEVLGGGIMHRYSKAPDLSYDAALRREVLAAADREHSAEIRRGMRWLDRHAARNPMIAEALAEKGTAGRGPP